MKEITLIRHGDTNATEKGYFSGWSDVPLSERGRERISRLRPVFNYQAYHTVFVSPLVRTRETFRLIFPQEEHCEIREEIKERSFGSWEGLSWQDIGRHFPEEIEAWKADPFSFTPPGGESFVQVKERIGRFWQELVNREDGRYLVVAHAGVIRCLLVHTTGMSFQATFHLLLDPGVQVGIRQDPVFTQVTYITNTEASLCMPC